MSCTTHPWSTAPQRGAMTRGLHPLGLYAQLRRVETCLRDRHACHVVIEGAPAAGVDAACAELAALLAAASFSRARTAFARAISAGSGPWRHLHSAPRGQDPLVFQLSHIRGSYLLTRGLSGTRDGDAGGVTTGGKGGRAPKSVSMASLSACASAAGKTACENLQGLLLQRPRACSRQ